MKLETFFEKFDELSDTPNGVKQLRELVLQLAVEGGLVPHSAAEPAVPYASLEDAAPINVSDVPENWRVVLLADAIKNRSGNSKLIKGKLHDEPAAGRFQGFSASGADVWCDDYEHEGAAIIISAVGARCGKAFKASGKWSAIANTNITRPQPSLFDFDFAYLVLNNEHFWVRGGSAQPFVKFPPSLDRHFALPPLAEQKRIVAKVNELMALCDRLEAQQQERATKHAALARASLARFALNPQPSTLNFLFHPSYAIPPADLRKSILTLAVQGKLVPHETEPNVDSLASILSEASVNGVSKGPTFDKSATEILRISAGTSRGDFYVNEDDFKHVDLPPNEIEKFQLAPGDLLACRFNGNLHYVGRFSYYRGDSGRVQVNPDKLIRFRIKTESHCPRYVCLAMNAAPTREAIEAMCATTAGNIGLSAGRLKTVEIPLPPLAEQRRIVAKVEQLMALVDALEQQLAASRATAANLLSALVAELTGTPNDGKVSVPSTTTTGRRGRPRKSP